MKIYLLFFILLLFTSCMSKNNIQVASNKKDLYQFPLYPWRHNYHQAIVFKAKSSTGDNPPSQVFNVQETLDQIKTLYNLSRGMPIIVYLSGWQQGGHDHQYPVLTRPGNHLMRPGIDNTPLEALRWLIQAAKEYNTVVSLQINLQKAVAENELYWQYKREGLFSSGPYEGFSGTLGRETNRINTKLEWERGYTQKRIDDLLTMLPELSEIGTIHIDNFRPFESQIHGTIREDIMPYLKAIMYYFKHKYGIDVTCESTFNKRPNNDNLYGFQPWALGFLGMDDYNMQVPAYLYCGGRKYQDEVFGTGADFMKLFYSNDYNFIKESLYTRSFALYYLSRLIRIEFSPITGQAKLSDNVICYDENIISKFISLIENSNKERLLNGYYGSSKSIIKCSDNLVKEGTDIFIPALWRYQKEVIAYSKAGYTGKSWIFPANWLDVPAVDIYEIRIEGLTLLEKNRRIQNNSIILTLKPNQALSILPGNTDLEYNPPIPLSGKVQFIGEDRETKGTWLGVYGTKGYEIVAGESQLPPNVTLSCLGGGKTIWSRHTSDIRALQKPQNPDQRMIATYCSRIHEIIDVQIKSNSSRENNFTEIALYFVDWHDKQKQMIVDAVCANTNHALDTRILRNFSNGVYLRYKVQGRIHFRLTILGTDGNKFEGGVVTFSGMFFN